MNTKINSPVQTGSVVQVVLQPKPMTVVPTTPIVDSTTSPAPVAEDVSEIPEEHNPTLDSLVSMLKDYAKKTDEYPQKLPDSVISKYVSLVIKYTAPDNIDPLWILSMMWQESKLKTTEVSSAGAIGLMQLMPDTAKGYGVRASRLTIPEVNIKAGVAHMHYLLTKYDNNLRMATIAYNQGTGNVSRGTYNTKYYVAVNHHYKEMSALLIQQYYLDY